MQKATTNDLHIIKKILLEHELPVEDLENDITFFVEKKNKDIICIGGLEKYDKYCLIRSIAVVENFKNQGLGTKMTKYLCEQAKLQKFEKIFLLTLTAEKYFPKFGFQKINRDQTPDVIKSSSEFSTVCPDSATVMELELKY